jgi:hypothetical protein
MTTKLSVGIDARGIVMGAVLAVAACVAVLSPTPLHAQEQPAAPPVQAARRSRRRRLRRPRRRKRKDFPQTSSSKWLRPSRSIPTHW